MYFVRELLPVTVQKSLVVRETVTGGAGVPAVIHDTSLVVRETVTGGAGVPAVIHDTPVPGRSNKIGMAKYNLVHAFRVAKKQAPWGKKIEAANGFLLAYNTGLLLPSVFDVVGKIKERTLDALDKKLRNNNDDYVCLCDGRGGWKKHGSNNYKGRKLSETAKAVFLRCYLIGSRPSVIMAIRAARITLAKNGIPEDANDSTWRRWLRDYTKYNAGVICLARDGMKAYQDQYGAYISRDANLLEVGQCLVADGKTLNFNILHPDTGRPCRMTMIVFFDWKSRYPAGWQIMPNENTVAILAAFRNSVEALGKYPESVYLDNGRAFKSKFFMEKESDFEDMTGLYARVGTAVMFAKPYNGRSKVVERFFKTFQSQVEFMMPSYCGDSISTKPPWMSRNEKFQKAWHKARTDNWIPTIREAAVIIDKYIQWYAQQPQEDIGTTPADLFLTGRGPGVDPCRLNYDFLWRKKVVPRRCRVTLWGIDYESDCLHNLSSKQAIMAMVDTADLDKIWCYTIEGVFLGEAHPVQACHPLARLFGDQVSLDHVTHENKRQARLAKSTRKQLEDLGINKNTQDSLGVLSFAAHKEKTPILPTIQTPGRTMQRKIEHKSSLSDKETRRLETVMARAEQENNALPEIPRPKYWNTDLEHYEWCFRLIHEHGRVPELKDTTFMAQFESLAEFDTYRQRFKDLKLVYDLKN